MFKDEDMADDFVREAKKFIKIGDEVEALGPTDSHIFGKTGVNAVDERLGDGSFPCETPLARRVCYNWRTFATVRVAGPLAQR